mgnify:CR=1 FL=1
MLNLLFYRTNFTGIGSRAVYEFGSSAYMGGLKLVKEKLPLVYVHIRIFN